MGAGGVKERGFEEALAVDSDLIRPEGVGWVRGGCGVFVGGGGMVCVCACMRACVRAGVHMCGRVRQGVGDRVWGAECRGQGERTGGRVRGCA